MIAKKNKILHALLGIALIAFGRASWIWQLAPLCAVCGYAFLWHATEGTTKRALSLWALFSLANLIHLHWLLSHPFLYIIAVWVVLSFFLALPYALISIWVVARPLSLFRILGLAALFALVEWSFTMFPCGFSFQTAALHLSWNPFSLQLASICGALGLSFLVFLTNLFFYSWMQTSIFGIHALCLAVLPYFLGGWLYTSRSIEQQKSNLSPLRAAICYMDEAPDVNFSHLSPYELHEYKWQQIFSLLLKPTTSNHALDLIILPEGAVPYPAQSPLFRSQHLPSHLSYAHPSSLLSSLELARLVARSHNASMLIGLESQNGQSSTNACFFISPTYSHTERYDKQLLLPFGEYIPLSCLRSFLKQYGVFESFSAGGGAKLLDSNNLRLAPLICYEETFSSYTRKAAHLNPTCLVSLNNDAWFPDSRLKDEHLEQARLRAVEVGIPLLRSCNKGISCGIDGLGRISRQGKNGHSSLIVSLSRYSPFSLFLLVGEESIVSLLVFIALFSFCMDRYLQRLRYNP